ncbi:MAG: hypothetical protein J6066_07595 [Lachnospiraceae bacterium]|nr:hypothetical protein [Lachnospiraceae bacterium]
MLELKDHFADNKDIYPWSAHTTFLIDRPDVIREALNTVTDEFKAFTGEVATLYLYEFWPSRHILTVQLKDRE